MTTYTIVQAERHGLVLHRGLSLDEAFFQLLAETDQDHVFERRPSGHALILWPRACNPFAPHTLTTWCEHAGDARMALMREALGAAFYPFIAMPDEAFDALMSGARAGAYERGARAFRA